ncbi:SDR family NAD(P)-dependent oxidoreductase [Helicobacter sp. 11S02629-2]|uniref:SDR family NAD(P)-dependent oxidoreductase n=1 Tax=Helicobacter sp. 11S02629-2 TaxID=1476195 RepID=UPI000BA6B553|nr:SDR family NAD(P)-dependent oxidoreductase [Helicobacter sp. 11S02629-2]PAF45665.1 hypothetical protein BKH40_01935 [Helicobacter sp. 11S02629-2]
MNVLITGASVGFGKEIAKVVCEKIKDSNFILLARRGELLKEVESELKAIRSDVKVELIVSDVLDFANLESKLKDKTIDVLVNNAGLALGQDLAQECSFKDWERMIDVNVKGLSFMTNLVLPGMVKRNNGHIINLGSTAGSYSYAGGNVYGGTKAFVEQFSKNLRADLLGTKIRVTNIKPGLCEGSEFSLVRFKGDKSRVKDTYNNANALTPKDIAEAIYFALSQPARVNINSIELMPVTQASAGLKVIKNEL